VIGGERERNLSNAGSVWKLTNVRGGPRGNGSFKLCSSSLKVNYFLSVKGFVFMLHTRICSCKIVMNNTWKLLF
jgi:hypothetical protein